MTTQISIYPTQSIPELESKWGMVAVLDILGYRNFVKTDRVREVAAVLVDTFNMLPDRVRNVHFTLIKKEPPKKILEDVLSETDEAVISDTIIITLPVLKEGSVPDRYAHFLVYVALLMRTLFDNGFPVRGCVEAGDYFIWQNLVAGKSLVEAYEHASDLQFAGCVVGATAYTAMIRDQFRPNPIMFRTEYPFCPLQGAEQSRDGWLLNWFWLPFNGWPRFDTDVSLEQIVTKSFTAHGKTIDDKVKRKLANTERLLKSSIDFIMDNRLGNMPIETDLK